MEIVIPAQAGIQSQSRAVAQSATDCVTQKRPPAAGDVSLYPRCRA